MKSLLLLLFMAPTFSANAEERVEFSFHLFNEPTQLDPQLTNSASGTYLITNLFRGLYRYRSDRGLVPEMAKKCERSSMVLRCTLKDGLRWSNGDKLTAEDFVRGFQRVIDPANRSQSADVLFALKNARAIWSGQMPAKDLGMVAEDATHIRFEFAENDLEFEYKLIHPALAPRRSESAYSYDKASSLIVNGPFKIVSWRQGHVIKLVSNNYYDSQHRPEVNVLFVDNDSTALRLYEAGKLTLLRRLVAAEIPRFRDRPEFHQVAMARFDYIGFGPMLKDFPKLRQALSESVDFASFHKLFESKGLPGCPSLPKHWLDKMPCEKRNLESAKKLLKASASDLKGISWNFGISQLGGEDIARAAEWFQNQWSKNLNLKIPIQPMEQGSYVQKLKSDPPAVFRKGVGLDRPTCAAALEIFTENSPENYIQLKDPEYNRLYRELLKSSQLKQRQVLCRRAVEKLINDHWIIPLGEMHFTVLATTRFKGWHINEINQLDLTDLRRVQ